MIPNLNMNKKPINVSGKFITTMSASTPITGLSINSNYVSGITIIGKNTITHDGSINYLQSDKINIWDHIKKWLIAIESHKEFKRKDLMTTICISNRHTLGCYLNLFHTAKYLKRQSRGVYIKILDPEPDMTSKDLSILAYGSKDKIQNVKDKIK